MIGAVIGDVVGSRFEWNNHRSKDFELFVQGCSFTDDSVMSLAICQALINCQADYSDLYRQTVISMQELGHLYPHCGYGGFFRKWLQAGNPMPYNSYGNGSAMRVGGCGFAARSLKEAQGLARITAETTHNHPEGIKGAESVAAAIYLAKTGSSMTEIRAFVAENYYPLDFTLESICGSYQFNVSCQGSVPQALEAFLESNGFEDAIRNAISIGGDSDTLAAITGSVAEAYYGVPDDLRTQAMEFLDEHLSGILMAFEARQVG